MANAKVAKTILGALIAAISLIPAATASQGVDTANPAFAPIGGRTSIPVGHAEFCKAHGDECGANARPIAAEDLTEGKWRQLLRVNAEINSKVVPVTDADLYQVAEFWTYPRGYGDCEDIALAKRQELIANGWDASTLLMTVVREQSGDGHAVLLVRTDRGDFVLDNQDGLVRLWNETPYTFLKRQSQANAGQWVDILDDGAVIVAASR